MLSELVKILYFNAMTLSLDELDVSTVSYIVKKLDLNDPSSDIFTSLYERDEFKIMWSRCLLENRYIIRFTSLFMLSENKERILKITSIISAAGIKFLYRLFSFSCQFMFSNVYNVRYMFNNIYSDLFLYSQIKIKIWFLRRIILKEDTV